MPWAGAQTAENATAWTTPIEMDRRSEGSDSVGSAGEAIGAAEVSAGAFHSVGADVAARRRYEQETRHAKQQLCVLVRRCFNSISQGA